MKVVSNTSPLCYLALIGHVHVLPALFGDVMIPEAVSSELKDARAPEAVRQWLVSPPTWLKIMPVPLRVDPILHRLHRGEQDAILLGQEVAADLLLLDEKAARKAAVDRGFNVTGLVGILDRAATGGLITLPSIVTRLSRTNFRIAPRILKTLLDKHQP